MTSATVKCLFCFGRLRQGLALQKDCHCLWSLWNREHLQRYGQTTLGCLSEILCWSNTSCSHEDVQSTAGRLRQGSDGGHESVGVMKRSVDSASVDAQSSSGSPKKGSRSSRWDKTERTAKESKTSKRSSSKAGSPSIAKHKDAPLVEPERLDNNINSPKNKSASGSLKATPPEDSGDTVTSQVQQLLKHSTGAESGSSQSDRVAWTSSNTGSGNSNTHQANSIPAWQSLSDTDTNSALQGSAGYIAQQLPLLPGIQPGALNHIIALAAAARSHFATQSNSYHTTPHPSQSQKFQHKPTESQGAFFEPDELDEDKKGESFVVMKAGIDDGAREGTAKGEGEALDDYEEEKYNKKARHLRRQWEYTPFGAAHESHWRSSRSRRHEPVEFSIMTYNILSQDLLQHHPYLYSGSASRSLEWELRRRVLVAEIAYHDADIVNLQEVHRDHFFEYLRPRLNKLGYEGRYLKRTGDKNDGCATMWKKDKFRLVASTPVNYCRGGLLDRDNIALIVELIPIRPGFNQDSDSKEDKVVVANTHLLFNPRRGDIKLAQLMVLMAEVDRRAYLGPSRNPPHHLHPYSSQTMATGRYCPAILTGDFNMEPHSDMYKFMVSGQLDYEVGFMVSGQLDYEGLLLRQIAGQGEGQYGRNQLLERNFFSPMYGVTDFCQYHTAVVDRLSESMGSSSPDFTSDSPPRSSSPERTRGRDSSNNSADRSSAARNSERPPSSSSSSSSSHHKEQRLRDSNTDRSSYTNNRERPSSSQSGKDRGSADRDSNSSVDSQTMKASSAGGKKQRACSEESSRSARENAGRCKPAKSMPINTGRIWHHMNLVSAYRHRVERLGLREAEVTTHHNNGQCTVDYIFYTVDTKEVNCRGPEVRLRNVQDGRLKLLSRLGLMSARELDDMGGIPNLILPSDHVCLISRFLLR